MTIEEKNIEEAAFIFRKNAKNDHYNWKREEESFIAGAKSPEAKEYWQKVMYSELEVLDIILELGKYDTLSYEWLLKWFKKHKK